MWEHCCIWYSLSSFISFCGAGGRIGCVLDSLPSGATPIRIREFCVRRAYIIGSSVESCALLSICELHTIVPHFNIFTSHLQKWCFQVVRVSSLCRVECFASDFHRWFVRNYHILPRADSSSVVCRRLLPVLDPGFVVSLFFYCWLFCPLHSNFLIGLLNLGLAYKPFWMRRLFRLWACYHCRLAIAFLFVLLFAK